MFNFVTMHEVGNTVLYVNHMSGNKYKCIVLEKLYRNPSDVKGYRYYYIIRSIDDSFKFKHRVRGHNNVNKCVGIYLEKCGIEPIRKMITHTL